MWTIVGVRVRVWNGLRMRVRHCFGIRVRYRIKAVITDQLWIRVSVRVRVNVMVRLSRHTLTIGSLT